MTQTDQDVERYLLGVETSNQNEAQAAREALEAYRKGDKKLVLALINRQYGVKEDLASVDVSFLPEDLQEEKAREAEVAGDECNLLDELRERIEYGYVEE